MFSMMDPFGQRPNHNNVIPCFIDLGFQSHSCNNRRQPFPFGKRHARNGYRAPEFRQGCCMSSPVENVPQRVFEEIYRDTPREQKNRKEKGNETKEKENISQRQRKSDSPDQTKNNQNKLQKEMDPHEPTLQDVLNHAMSVFRDLKDVQNGKWQEQIDCRGFDSRNIKVKIGSHELVLKAFRKQESENEVQTMSMRRSVPLPKSIDSKRIKCKLSSNGFLIIEAPYLDNDGNRITVEFANGIVASMIPGFEQLMRYNESSTESQEKEKKFDKCADKSEETFDICTETCGQEKENRKTINDSNGRDDDAFTEQKQVVSDIKDDTSQTNTHELNKMETESSVSKLESNAEVKENDGTQFTEDDGDANSKHELYRDETDSNASDNSFVLLSQLVENGESIVSAEDDHDKSPNDGFNDMAVNKDTVNTEEEEVTNDCKEDGKTQSLVQNENESNATTENDHSQYDECKNDKDKVLFRLEMPSYNPESMKVTFDNTKRLLSISTSKDQTRPKAGSPSEPITKTVPVDDDVDVAGLQCYFRDGTLTVTAPLKPVVRTIPIEA